MSQDFQVVVQVDDAPAAGGDPATEEGVQLALALRTVLAAQRREQARVMDSLDYCLGTLSFLRNLPMAAE